MTALLLHVGRGGGTLSPPRPLCGPAGPSVAAHHLPVTCGQITDQSPNSLTRGRCGLMSDCSNVVFFLLCFFSFVETFWRRRPSSITQQIQTQLMGLNLRQNRFVFFLISTEATIEVRYYFFFCFCKFAFFKLDLCVK